jgi:sulfur relay (sulfurtransferase) DsrC/TusE family protein
MTKLFYLFIYSLCVYLICILNIKTLILFKFFFPCSYIKYDDDQEEKSDSKWEIINYLRKNYKVDEKTLKFYSNFTNMPKTLTKKVDELYRIIRKNDTCPVDIAKFVIDLHDDFPINIPIGAVQKAMTNELDNSTSKEWVKFFKEDFPEILDKFPNFEGIIKIIITRVDEKLNNFNLANEVADKVEEFTD